MSEFDIFSQANIYNFGKRILVKFPDLEKRFKEDTIVPDQVEIHLPPKGKKLCWLDCPHCYTHVTRETVYTPISLERLLNIIQEISDGHPKTGEMPEKIIISGFNTDPLNSSYIEPVAKKVKQFGFMLGVHTKGLIISDSLIEILTCANQKGDYISFSTDAGSDLVFNISHGVKRNAKLFTQIKHNLIRLINQKHKINSSLKLVATYLITNSNCKLDEIKNFTSTMMDIGVDHIRFSEPIRPVMGFEERPSGSFPQAQLQDIRGIRDYVLKLKERYKERIHYLDFQSSIVRLLPCYSRWMLPTIGYDGYLYPCCLTASQQFDSLRLVDLEEVGFWDAYYKDACLDFNYANCQCDRKAAFINSALQMELNYQMSKHDI